MIHGEDAPIGNGEPAEMNPACDGAPALIKHFAGLSVKGVKNGMMRILAALLIGEEFLAMIDDRGALRLLCVLSC